MPTAQNASASCPIFPHGHAERHPTQTQNGRSYPHIHSRSQKKKNQKEKDDYYCDLRAESR
jgi:hypothetical protein